MKFRAMCRWLTLVCASAVLFAVEAAYTVNDYIKSGLVLHFDAEYNQGTGQTHDSSATTWVDLSGNGQTATKSGDTPTWGKSEYGKPFMNPNNNATGFRGYTFTPAQVTLDAVNAKPSHVTYEYCARVKTFYTDMSFWGFAGSGGKFGSRFNGGKTAYFAARGSESNGFGSYGTQMTSGYVDIYSYDQNYLSRFVDNTLMVGPSAFNGGTSLTTGGGKLGSCVYSNTKSDYELYTARLYSRALKRIEAVHNANIDRVRYFSMAEPTKPYVDSYVSVMPTTYGTATPKYNTLTAVTAGTAQTFSIAGLTTSAFDAETVRQVSTTSRAVYEGFDLTTIALDGTEATVTYPKSTTSVAATVDTDTFATWKFRLQYGLFVTAGSGGKVIVAGASAVDSSESWYDATNSANVIITAVPDENNTFLGWSGDVSDLAGQSSDLTRTAVMTKGRTIVANFARGGKGDGSTYVWKGGGATTAWTDGSNWEGGLTPLESDHAVVSPAADTTIALSGSTPRYASLVMGGGSGKVTLTVANWGTAIQADKVTIGSKGLIQPLSAFSPQEASNRIWIVCNDFELKSGGQLNANERGWKCHGTAWYGAGPGGGQNDRGGAGYGGRGSNGNNPYNFTDGRPYGSIVAPCDPGSGGGRSSTEYTGAGGGAIRIDASGNVCIDGDIVANGQISSAKTGGGSGGGIYISAATVSGAGTISARGGRYDAGGTNRGGGDAAADRPRSRDGGGRGETAAGLRLARLQRGHSRRTGAADERASGLLELHVRRCRLAGGQQCEC